MLFIYTWYGSLVFFMCYSILNEQNTETGGDTTKTAVHPATQGGPAGAEPQMPQACFCFQMLGVARKRKQKQATNSKTK